ncbi:hypothetical protein [Peribacillus simplex]|uniref:hypothetical protein n=1 Tax=Peribacillus simplex TaxID=1478 RepID=UPI003D9C5A9B
MDRLQKNLEDAAKAEAEKYGLKVSFEYQDEFPETLNHKESSDKIRQVCNEKGIPMAELTEAFRALEDFGHYTKLTKGSYCYIGNGEDYPNLTATSMTSKMILLKREWNCSKDLLSYKR